MEVIVRNCQFETYLWVDGALCRLEDLPEAPELSEQEKQALVKIADKLWMDSSKIIREEILLLTRRPQ